MTSGASGRERRFDRIKPTLVCPRCRGDLQFDAHAASCTPCQARFPIRNHQIFFIDVPPQDDEFDRIKAWLKRRLGTVYYSVGVTLFAPTFPLNLRGAFTHRGHELLFARWSTVACTNPTGPVTVGLVHFSETVATLLSFGSASMKAFAYLALCAILFPVKFLDAPFVGRGLHGLRGVAPLCGPQDR